MEGRRPNLVLLDDNSAEKELDPTNLEWKTAP
jgi:hypothetical protein